MTSKVRPDIIVFDSELGGNTELDVALAHPWSSDIFPKSSDVVRAAAKCRRTKRKTGTKRRGYQEEHTSTSGLKILENFHVSHVTDESMNNLSIESSAFFPLTQALEELTHVLGQQVQEKVYDELCSSAWPDLEHISACLIDLGTICEQLLTSY